MGNASSVSNAKTSGQVAQRNIRATIKKQQIVNAAVGLDSSISGAVKSIERKTKQDDWMESFRNENRSENEEKRFKQLWDKYPEMREFIEDKLRPEALDLEKRVSLLRGENLNEDTFAELGRSVSNLFLSVYAKVQFSSHKERKDILRLAFYDLTVRGGIAKTFRDLYFKILNQFGKITEDNVNNPEGEFITEIVGHLVNLTDESPQFAYRMEEYGVLESLIKAADVKENLDLDELSEWMSGVLGVVYNCAKAGVSKQFYKKHKTLDIIRPFIDPNTSNNDLSSLSLMTMAYLIDEEDVHLLQADCKIIDYLIKEFIESLQAIGPKVTSEGWSLEELTIGLARIASNDDNKRYLFNKGILPYIIQMTEENDEEIIEYALQLLWILSFNKDNKKDLGKEKDVIQVLMKWSKYDDNSDIKKAALGALWNLGYSDLGKKDTDSNAEKKDGKVPHVMISYQWDVQKLVLKVRDELRKRDYNVWMDVDEMGGSTLDAMSKAVEGAAVVLVFMSSKYRDSPNCRAEGEYAFTSGKDVVPVLVEKGYKANGWLGPVIGAKFYIDLTIKARSFDIHVESLLRELGERGREMGPSKEPRSNISNKDQHQSSSLGKGVSISELALWSTEKTSKWFRDHGVQSNKLDNLNGEDIVTFINLRQEAPEFFFSYVIVKQLNLTTVREIGLFSKAMDNI